MPLKVLFTKNNVTRKLLGEKKTKPIYESMDIQFCCKEASESFEVNYFLDNEALVLRLQIPTFAYGDRFNDQRERLSNMKYCSHCGEKVVFEMVREANITYTTETISKTIEETTQIPIIDILWEDKRFKRKETISEVVPKSE